jgi:hypothetical protein
VIPGSAYHREIAPITWPLMEDYAEKHGMWFTPHLISPEERAPFLNKSPAPAGTEANYANIPRWRQLLDQYAGVVLLDCDVVIVDDTEDICATVDDHQPIGSSGGFGVAVTKSCDLSRAYLDTIWAMRDYYMQLQWLEQAAAVHLIGWDPVYPGDGNPPVFLGDTAWCRYYRDIGQRWNSTPTAPAADPLFMHPAGIQPYSRRLELVKQYALCAADLSPSGRLAVQATSQGETT